MADLATWIDSAWFVWVGMATSIAIVIVIVSISKAKARSRDRIPQYRRHTQA